MAMNEILCGVCRKPLGDDDYMGDSFRHLKIGAGYKPVHESCGREYKAKTNETTNLFANLRADLARAEAEGTPVEANREDVREVLEAAEAPFSPYIEESSGGQFFVWVRSSAHEVWSTRELAEARLALLESEAVSA